jgi:UDP:flavonoid glycosyltransferase YjiC (YdhE family)
MHEAVARAGLRPVPLGVSVEELRQGGIVSRADGSNREDRIASFLFTKVWPESALPGLLAIGHQWKPDAIVHEEGEYTAPIGATLLRLPSIAVSWAGPARTERQWQILERAVTPLWRSNGLEPARRAGLFRTLYLDTCPPVLQGQAIREERVTPMRPVPYDAAEDWEATGWLANLGRGAIFVTLGTVPAFNNAPEVIRQVIDAFRDEPRQVVISIGDALDLRLLGEVPSNVHLTKFVPQSLMDDKAALVICHAGPGTATSALRSGTPLLLMPRGGAVQKRVADACANSGVAIVLPDAEVSAERIRAHARELIESPGYREAALRIAERISAMPGPEDVITLVERAIKGHVEVALSQRTTRTEGSPWNRLQ